MSGKATFHTKIARAFNHFVTSKQYSSQDSAGYVPLKYRNLNKNKIQLPHRISGYDDYKTTNQESEKEKLNKVDDLCLILYFFIDFYKFHVF